MSIATLHSSSSTQSLSTPRVVPLTELAETAQIVLSAKPRLINVTHQMPYSCTLNSHFSGAGPNSPPNRRTPHVSPGARQQAAPPQIQTPPPEAHLPGSGGAARLSAESLAAAHVRNVKRAGGSSARPTVSTATSNVASPTSSASSSPRGGETFPVTDADQKTGENCILHQRRGHSALYSGIMSLKPDLDTVQIGWVGEMADQDGYVIPSKALSEAHKNSIRDKLWEKEQVVPIFLDDDRAAGHYEGYCKSVLWPLFHYILWDEATDGRLEKKNWDDYVFVNQQFTDAIVAQYQPGDIVWIHDYHLLLVPHMLRQKLPSAAIGVFIHAPFPSSEIFRCLPKRVEILNGLLGANQIGFQTYSYARHFISSCTRVNGYESNPRGVDAMGSTVWVGTFPIGIDAERVERQRKSPGVMPKMEAIRETYAGKKIIVGRDKLDLVKGVHQKLQAFEKFLNDYPEMQGEVVLIQVTSPPLVENPKLEAKIAELVAHINGTYGSLNFTPVHHYHQHIDRDEYYALLSVADIGLITSVRDGMNTTSLEYIMCQAERQGPLILSEFTGTAGSLGGALMVNPWDYQGVAKVIYDAINLTPEEKLTRHTQLHKHVLAHTAQFWAKNFIAELVLNVSTGDQSTPTPYLDLGIINDCYRGAKKRLLMFDYDGTLTPIRKTPGAAIPQEHMLKALEALTNDPNNVVWVISGRDQKVLEEWLGHLPNLGFSAEHGSFMRQPGSTKWTNLTESLDMSWKSDVIEIFTYYTERTQGSFIEHKRSSLTWHYRMADPEFGAFQAKECQNHLENAVLCKMPVEILVGKKNLEVRPTIVNKGEIVKRLLAQHPEVEFVLCAGDDKTDEDMFRALSATSSATAAAAAAAAASAPGRSVVAPNGIVHPTDKVHALTGSGLGYVPTPTSQSPAFDAIKTVDTDASVPAVALNGTSPLVNSEGVTSAGIPKSVSNHFSITIGHALKKTLAKWHVTSPEELIRVIGIMAGTVDV